MITLQQINFQVPGLLRLGRALFFPTLFLLTILTARAGSFSAAERPTGAAADTTNVEAEICTGLAYEFGDQQLTESGTYTETFIAEDGSDSTVVLVLTVLPTSETNLEAVLCEGETYAFNGEDLTDSGFYTVTLTTDEGCDSIVNLNLTVLPTSETNLEAVLCEGETYAFNGEDLTDSGFYTVTLTTDEGCDSIVNLNLTVLPTSETVFTAGICTGTTYVFEGDTLDETGAYIYIYPAANGCDSLVVLKLLVADFFETELFATICDGESYTFGGNDLTESGVYSETVEAVGGCDSTLILHLNVLPPNPVTEIEATICDNETYAFGGEALTDAGEYTAVFADQNGCDSTVMLTLSVLPTATTEIEATLCAGESFEAGGETLTESGDYTFVLSSENGCDSTVTVALTVLPAIETLFQATICNGETYPFEGDELDESGTYSVIYTAENGCDSTVTLTLEILPELVTHLEATICANEAYDFNGDLLTDAGEYTVVLLSELGCDSTVTLTLIVAPLEETLLAVTLCAGESIEFDGETLTETGEYAAVLTSEFGCDSTVTLSLTVLDPIPPTEEFAKICAGETFFFNGLEITEAGIYEVTLSAENGCDSVVVLNLGIVPVVTVELEATICAGETYEFDGDDLTESGVYTHVTGGSNGCDSTTVLTLTVNPVYETTLDVAICFGFGYEFDGFFLDTEGTYTAQYVAENGCDSTVVLNLTVLPLQETSISATICANETYLFDGKALNAPGTYTAVFADENGCDSTVTLVLEVLQTPITQLSVTICGNETYEFGGEPLSTTGSYALILTAENGCDSFVVLNLTVFPAPTVNLNAQICAGEEYTFEDQTLTESGVYSVLYMTSNGCDSLISLTLIVTDTIMTHLLASICAGETYEFDGQDLTESGTYEALYVAEAGCDSLVVLTLEVLPGANTDFEASICAGESYEFEGAILTDSGIYAAVFTAENGCDSTVTLILTVLPTYTTDVEASICAGDTYEFNGEDVAESGTYTALLSAENGCDSIVTLILTVLPTYTTDVAATICAGESYAFNGDDLTDGGTYTALLSTENGCDSTVTLVLTVLPTYTTDVEATICAGDTYEFNGNNLTDGGTYTALLSAENGCDSTVTLVLTVLPTYTTDVEATICAGDTYEFNGADLTESGTYTALLSAANGCDSIVTLVLTVLPELFTQLSAAICAGETYPFAGQALSQPGVYSAILPGSTGCDSTVVLTLAVTTVNVAVTLQSNTLTAQANNATYQWINCATNQPIAGATGQSFTPSLTGNYAVLVTQSGCTAQSICTQVIIVSTGEPLATLGWQVQPNPARDVAYLQLEQALESELEVEIYTIAGRQVLRQTAPVGTLRLPLDLNGLTTGLYVVRLTDGRFATTTKRLLITRE